MPWGPVGLLRSLYGRNSGFALSHARASLIRMRPPGNGQPHFFIAEVKAMVTPSAAASWVWLSSRGELLGKLRSSSFSFWVIGVCGGGLEVDDIRGDGRAGEAVAFDVGGVG